MDWDRWWEKEEMAHAIVRVDNQLTTLRIRPVNIAHLWWGELELLTKLGWVPLHQSYSQTFKPTLSSLFELASYAEAIYPGMYHILDNSNIFPSIAWETK